MNLPDTYVYDAFPATPTEDETIVTNANGGKQSFIKGRYDILPFVALKSVAEVLAEGADKYGEWNWHDIESKYHLNHAIKHALKAANMLSQEGSNEAVTYEELSHAATRILFALETYIKFEHI